MKSDKQWDALTKLARQAPGEALPAAAPLGFATRVAARWQAAEPVSLETVWAFLSLRSLGLAALLMMVSLSINYDLIAEDWSQDLAMADSVFATVLEP